MHHYFCYFLCKKIIMKEPEKDDHFARFKDHVKMYSHKTRKLYFYPEKQGKSHEFCSY